MMLSQLPVQLLFFLATASLLPSTASLLPSTASLLPSTASTDAANWLFPAVIPNAPLITFESQDTIDASWTSSLIAPVLRMFCRYGDATDYSLNFQSPAPVLPNGSYAISLSTVQEVDATCHLYLEETNGPFMGTSNSSNSASFLVNVLSDRPATTWSTSVPAATTSSSSPTSTPTATSASTPSTPTTTAKPPGLGTGAKAGISVGVALGVVLLLTLTLLLWPRARRRNLFPGIQKPQDVASEMDGENTVSSEMDGGGRSTHREAGEKDGFPVARPQTAAGELDAGGGR